MCRFLRIGRDKEICFQHCAILDFESHFKVTARLSIHTHVDLENSKEESRIWHVRNDGINKRD